MFEKIKLIAIDMDGTLLNNAKEMPAGFIPWVKEHPHIKIVIASGRQYYTLKRDFEEISDQIIFISDNGGLATYKDEIIYSDLMTDEDVYACLDALDTIPSVVPFVCGLDCAYMPPSDEEGMEQGAIYYARLKQCENLHETTKYDRIIKVAIYIPGSKAEEISHHFPLLPDSLLEVLSGDSWIDIANRTVHKGAALAAIQKKYALDKSECMAFGDYPNDISMLAVCEESFCMANGHDSVKEVAKHIAPSNEEEGVMQVLNSFS